MPSSEQNLPPTQDALLLHCKRVNYQAAIHQRALQSFMDAPLPMGYGWELNDEYQLEVTWMTKKPAPDEILIDVHCSCKLQKCVSKRCTCVTANLSCTDLCKCKDCENSACLVEANGHCSSSDIEEEL